MFKYTTKGMTYACTHTTDNTICNKCLGKSQSLHDTYIQSEKEFEEKFDLTEEIDSKLQSHIRTTLIKQFQAYVKELEGERKEKLQEYDLEQRAYIDCFNNGLQLAIDKANNFIKYLEQQ